MTPRKAVLLALAATFGGFALFAWSGTRVSTRVMRAHGCRPPRPSSRQPRPRSRPNTPRSIRTSPVSSSTTRNASAWGAVPTNMKQYAARYLKTRKAQVTAEIDKLYAKANKAAKLEKTSREIGLIVWCHLVEPEMTKAFKQAAKVGNL